MKSKGKSTLLLNASYEPLSVVSAQRAITLIVQGRAVSLDNSPYSFGSESLNIDVPYVARLNNFVKRSSSVKAPRFSRRGVLIRDNNLCVYCGAHATTIDHVLPRASGGISTYENCVAACINCNRKKGHRLLKDLGWSLKTFPVVPSMYENFLNKARNDENVFSAWSEYIYMYDPALKKRKLLTP